MSWNIQTKKINRSHFGEDWNLIFLRLERKTKQIRLFYPFFNPFFSIPYKNSLIPHKGKLLDVEREAKMLAGDVKMMGVEYEKKRGPIVNYISFNSHYFWLVFIAKTYAKTSTHSIFVPN